MTDLNEREKAFEKKYALDQELMFRIEARTAKLFGLWLAEKAGLGEAEAKEFAGSLVSANLDEPGFDDVKRAAAPFIQEKGLGLSGQEVDSRLMALMEEARVQIESENR
jgi:hypothetical protein